MKRRKIKQGVLLLAITFLLFGTLPCQAMTAEQPQEVSSMRELLTWYHELTGTGLQECGVTAPAVCSGEVVLEPTSCRVDIIFINGLHIPSGSKLTVDNPNLVLMGPPPVIVVEKGGVLQIRRLNALSGEAMPTGAIVVEKGGTLLLENGVTLPDGVVQNQNPPPNILPPIVEPETETPTGETETSAVPETAPNPQPDASDKLENDVDEKPPAEKPSLQGSVLKVTEKGVLSARLTVPFVDPLITESVTIERSRDSLTWNAEYVFRWNKDDQEFQSENGQFGILGSKNRSDRSKTDFQYLAKLSGAPFYLRVTVTGADGTKTVSNPIQLTEPPVGQYQGSDDYEDNEGNRGGGGQGTSDREAQKEAASSGGGSLPATSKEKTEAFTGTALPAESNLPLSPQAGADAFAPPATEPPLPSTPNTVTESPLPSAPHTETESTLQDSSQAGTNASPSQATEDKPLASVEEQAQAVDEEAVSVAGEGVFAVGQSDQEEKNVTLDSTARGGLAAAATLVLCGIIWAATRIKSFKRKKS